MMGLKYLKAALVGGAAVVLTTSAYARQFDIPGGDLANALSEYSSVTGVQLIYAETTVSGIRTRGVKGDLSADAALSRLLSGTNFVPYHHSPNVIGITRQDTAPQQARADVLADAAPARAASSVETVIVTSSKIKGDIQTIPIAITALSQEELTTRQIAGGPDLVKEVPNLTFSKTNFSGYNLQIRGIGTQAVSVTIDPAVAVAFNDTPFLRNHFFEQEFYDLSQVEILRGPQGTLFGRNANAGVANLISAKPTDKFEAMLSADWGNYSNRRYEGMVNIPIVEDKLMLRVAGEWTKRDGYAFNETTGHQTDGRDLWSTRATLRWKPVESFTADLIWEHFQENDDRLRSGKQLCKTDPGPTQFIAADGTVVHVAPSSDTVYAVGNAADYSQGCLPTGLYSKDAFEVPNGYSLGYVTGLAFVGGTKSGIDPYACNHSGGITTACTQSTNLRDIQSGVNPIYRANNDTLELNAEWNISPALTFDSATGYNNDFLWSTEDFNRFETSPGIFAYNSNPTLGMTPDPNYPGSGIFCDNQLGCSDRLIAQDLDTETAWQFSQELRLASNFEGPFNFSAGGNYLHYETTERFYVFSNAFTILSLDNAGCDNQYVPGVTTHQYCINNGRSYNAAMGGNCTPTECPQYLDPSPITDLKDDGHNYFISKNPYILNSYALFGEAYYNITPDLKLTAGIRWTDDQKHFPEFPSRLLTYGYGNQRIGAIDQSWEKFSGRAVANWTPKLDFTDQTMVYASFSHGYKAGGANPPPAIFDANQGAAFPIHPLTFEPEYINAYELGTKNTALDGALTFDADVFYYDYTGYQISQLVDRTSVNINVNATVRGAEIQTSWSPFQGFKLGFNGGYEDTRIKDNQYFIDLMDRTYGHHDAWTILKPWPGEGSNCVVPDYVAAALIQAYAGYGQGNPGNLACGYVTNQHVDPVTLNPYTLNPTPADYNQYASGVAPNYPGYDPISNDPLADPATVNDGLGFAPNNSQGFEKPIGGNQLPNAPHFTVSFTGDYTMPVSANWAATLHSDFYWQSQSMARIFNDRPYDKIRGYSNVNLALILTDASGWQVMGYVKNIFDVTAITGDFLYTDDVGLTTNVFVTDPRLYGVRITKQFEGGSADDGGFDLFSNADGKQPEVWLTLGGNYNAMLKAAHDIYQPDYKRPAGALDMTQSIIADGLSAPSAYEKSPNSGFDWQAALSFQPSDSDWVLKAGIRYGRSSRNNFLHQSKPPPTKNFISVYGVTFPCTYIGALYGSAALASCEGGQISEFIDAHNSESERHTILDFTLGKDVGIGTFGGRGTSNLAAGLRAAQFGSLAVSDINSDSENHFVPDPFAKYHNVYESRSQERRGFRGIGPEIAWDSTQPVWGNPSDGELSIDWGVNVGVLFGRQAVSIHHFSSYCYEKGIGAIGNCVTGLPGQTQTKTVHRSKNVTVPNLGGYAGLSMNYHDAKISFGYRADEFFGAMDGGQATAKKYNRGFYGPYLNLSIGFGG